MFSRNSPSRKAFSAKASRMSNNAVDKKLAEIQFGEDYTPILGSSLFATLEQGAATAHIMAIRGMTADTYLVRSTSPEYVDLRSLTLTGHCNPVARILDPYDLGPNPFIPGLMLPKPKKADSLGLDCLNVVHTSYNISLSRAKRMVSGYGNSRSIVVAFQVRDVLKVGGKIYLDTTSSLENALLIALPVGARINFRVI
ncbi:AvrPphF family type III effector [Citrobacter cronae]|nr:AvrPphF family type III effector [Citrobacter cronae]